MTELIVFGIQLGIALTVSLLVLYLIKPFLKDVLKDTCGTEHSAEFWVRFTQLMMIIAPLVIVIFYASVNSEQLLLTQPAYILKQTLLQTLVGVFVGLIFVGRIIYRAINTAIELAQDDVNHHNDPSSKTAQA